MKNWFANFYSVSEKRILLCSLLLGLLTFFASAPFFVWVFLLLPFGFLADILYNANNTKQRFFRLFVFLLGYHFANFHWMLFALTTDSIYYWIIPFGAIFICGTFALMCSFTMLPYLFVAKKYSSVLLTYFGISFGWILFEFIKGYFPFSGLPWQGIGMIFAGHDYLVQVTSIVGIFGCNIIAILLGLSPFLMLRLKKARHIIILLLILSYLGLFFYGYNRLSNAKKATEFYDLPIIGMQSNIDIQTIMQNTNDDRGVLKYIEDSQIATEIPHKDILLIWPESAIGAYSDFGLNQQDILKNLMKVMPKNIKYLLFGSLYFKKKEGQFFNRISLIDRKGEIIDFYDKIKLVPFGEYIPPRNFFPFLTQKITGGMIDITAGKEYKLIDIDGIKIAPLICFESIFAGRIFAEKIKDADVIIQVTNDGWFGNSVGPYQHLAFSKMLSVSYKTPFIRVSNNGVSAVYNEYGILQQSTILNTSSFVYMPNLPKKQQ